MRRIFGKSKAKEPEATLDDVSGNIDKRGDQMDAKIKKLNVELSALKKQMVGKTPAAKRNLQQRALRLLKQKKMYEKNRDNLYSQQFNIDQTKFATDGLKDNAQLVAAMKTAHKGLQSAYKEIDIDEVEDLHEDMSEMMEMSEEVNEVLGRSYGIDQDMDEDELLGELDDLEDELALEEDEEVPSYLVSAQAAGNKITDTAKPVQEDDMGLPVLPSKVTV